jgi:crotonobetainyl-CoA:carnitine CoA-transferase CaiB-like acyl-CoA transferase
MPIAIIDVLLDYQLKEAILLALLGRTYTGKGMKIQASLFDAGVSSLVNQAANYLVANEVAVRQGSEHPNISPYGMCFLTSDNHFIVIAA